MPKCRRVLYTYRISNRELKGWTRADGYARLVYSISNRELKVVDRPVVALSFQIIGHLK